MNGLYAIAGAIVIVAGSLNAATDGTNSILWITGFILISMSVVVP